eukprot:g18811.t1
MQVQRQLVLDLQTDLHPIPKWGPISVNLESRDQVLRYEKRITDAAMKEAIKITSDHLRIAGSPWFVLGLRTDHDIALAQYFFPSISKNLCKLRTQKDLKLHPEIVKQLGRMFERGNRLPYLSVFAPPDVCEEAVDEVCEIPVKEKTLSSMSFCRNPLCKGWFFRTSAGARAHRNVHAVLEEMKKEKKQKENIAANARKALKKSSAAVKNKRKAQEAAAAEAEQEDSDDFFVTEEQVVERRKKDKNKVGDVYEEETGAETAAGVVPKSKKQKTSSKAKENSSDWVNLRVGKQDLDDLINKGEDWKYQPAGRYSGNYMGAEWRVENTPVSDSIYGTVKELDGTKWMRVTSFNKPKSKNVRPTTMRNLYLKAFKELQRRIAQDMADEIDEDDESEGNEMQADDEGGIDAMEVD